MSDRDLRKQTYKLMDSFLLNQDRHLFVDNILNLSRSWALEMLVETLEEVGGRVTPELYGRGGWESGKFYSGLTKKILWEIPLEFRRLIEAKKIEEMSK